MIIKNKWFAGLDMVRLHEMPPGTSNSSIVLIYHQTLLTNVITYKRMYWDWPGEFLFSSWHQTIALSTFLKKALFRKLYRVSCKVLTLAPFSE